MMPGAMKGPGAHGARNPALHLMGVWGSEVREMTFGIEIN